MNNSYLESKFDDFFNSREKGVAIAKKIKEAGGKIAGTFCSFAPIEVLDAAGIHSINLSTVSNSEYISAEIDLPRNLCPLIKASYGYVTSDKYDYAYLSDILIGETTCDGKKKMYELLGDFKETYVMQLPQGIDRSYSYPMWTREVHRLIKIIEEKFDVQITGEKLREAVSLRKKLKSAYCELFELGKLEPPAISGLDMYKIIENAGFIFDLNEQYTKLRELIDKIKNDYNEGTRPIDKNAKRILITGCPINGVLDKVVKNIEDSDAVVVCFENCGGIKPARNIIDEESDDIVKAIADGYLNIGCSIMTPNLKRMEMLSGLLQEFKVEGVIEITLQTCHPYSVEKRTIKKLVNDLGIPYFSIETDYSDTDIGQIKTRISAFIETL